MGTENRPLGGCLTCKHYDPNPRWNSTPVCTLGGCRYERRGGPGQGTRTAHPTCEDGMQSGQPSPELDGKNDYAREYALRPWYFDTGD